MSSRPDISVVLPTTNPKYYAIAMDALDRQSTNFKVEIVVVQEAYDFAPFYHVWAPSIKLIRQEPHYDCGAAAKDAGVAAATGKYIVFWDDDNLYYEGALQSTYEEIQNGDLIIMKVRHLGRQIPMSKNIIPGEIDTMCICAKSDLAKSTLWADGQGRYSDYRWVSKLAQKADLICYSDVVIGEHL